MIARNRYIFLTSLKSQIFLFAVQELSISIDFSLTEKAAFLIFISGRGSLISSAKQDKSGSIYNLVKHK